MRLWPSFASLVLLLGACNGQDQPAGPAPGASTAAASASAKTQAPKPAAKKVVTVTTESKEALAAFEKARDLSDNLRGAEAIEEAKKAVAADPNFARAHALLGWLLPGADGVGELEKAAALAAKLPEAERLYLEAQLAARRGESEQYYKTIQRVAELAPDDSRVQLQLANVAMERRELDKAVAGYRRATELEPSAVEAWNSLAYVLLQQRKFEPAVAAAKKYVELRPKEPNGHDTLGEMLLNAGKTAEAEAELQKAVELSPKFHATYLALGLIKELGNDMAGAKAAFAKAKENQALPTDAVERGTYEAWTLMTEGKDADALKALDALEQQMDSDKSPWPAAASFHRSFVYYALGKYADSAKAAAAALERCVQPPAALDYTASCRRWAAAQLLGAQIMLGKKADIDKSLVLVAEEAKKAPNAGQYQITLAVQTALAEAILARDDKAVVAALSKCEDEDFWCAWDRLRYAKKVGDDKAAEAARQVVLGRIFRDPAYPWVAAQVRKQK